jgi:hypothetical protein
MHSILITKIIDFLEISGIVLMNSYFAYLLWQNEKYN